MGFYDVMVKDGHPKEFVVVSTNDGVLLAHLEAGEGGIVLRLEGGKGFVGRMAALGFTPGATLNVVRNSGRGPIIVDVLDTQIALGRGQARRVYVRRRGEHE